MQIFQKNEIYSNYILQKLPSLIQYNMYKPATLHFDSAITQSAFCLQCMDKRCIYYSNAEIDTGIVKNFSYDKNCNVCPTGALYFSDEEACIKCDSDKCLRCGICISRCPVGAIYLDKNNTIQIEKIQEKDTLLYSIDISPHCSNLQERQINELLKIKKTGNFIYESGVLISLIYEKINIFSKIPNFPDLFVRNLLIALGLDCQIRRIGDAYTRMDGIYKYENRIGSLEIEFGNDTLDAARATLDDIAILATRYKIDKKENNVLVVTLKLPRNRQGYFQVIKDISTVENIYIKTISVGALLILLWNNKKINLLGKAYYIDFDNESIRQEIENTIERKINIRNGFNGLLEPEK